MVIDTFFCSIVRYEKLMVLDKALSTCNNSISCYVVIRFMYCVACRFELVLGYPSGHIQDDTKGLS